MTEETNRTAKSELISKGVALEKGIKITQQSNIDYTIDTSTKTITIIGGGTDISTDGIITKSIS